MKKLLTVGVIVLFLGLACAPSINANISRDNELVEITTEVCGLGGGKYTVHLTQEEAEEVDRLFENIQLRLNESTSKEEAVEIFNDAIVELDKYGLLGGLSVEQAQRLVTGKYNNFGENKIIKQFLGKILPIDENNNYLCLTAGSSELCLFGGFPFTIVYFLGKLFGFSLGDILNILVNWNSLFAIIFKVILFVKLFFRQVNPWNFMNIFSFDGLYGVLFTFGLNGFKIWNTWEDLAMGYGFSGLKIFIPYETYPPGLPEWGHFFIGFTLIVEDYT